MRDPNSHAEPAPVGAGDPAHAFERLAPGVQKWVWNQGWPTLRSVQALAVDPVLANRDVLISAATAAGKTEAAWLPVASNVAADPERSGGSGVQALYIGPLKALINDQFLRLQSLGETADIAVHRWHGDVAASAKKTVRTKPEGILLITPESLEALFVREGPRVPAIFAGLKHIVIDEFHSFIGSERGAQLQSLMHRLDLAVRRKVPRIGLSATLADLTDAAEYLRPGAGTDVTLVVAPNDEATEIRLQVRGYIRHNPQSEPTAAKTSSHDVNDADEEDAGHSDDAMAIGGHLFRTLRGTDNLVFANSRSSVEAYTDILNRLSADMRVPNEFHAHHGSLSKEHREGIENKLRSTETPATAICTSTLEMGIDIGSTDSVAQVGSPPSVAALRQRLGRSGRRGKPATIRIYIPEAEVTDRTPPTDMLRAQLIQTVAMTDLMLVDRWYEPPNLTDLHLSTLIQQTLSVTAQHGGATAAQLYSALCGNGPFSKVAKDVYLRLLRDMGKAELLTQTGDGLLLAGPVGDRIINHYSFYSAFQSSEEYRLMARGRTLGTIPVDYPVLVGSFLIFAGLRWQVVDVDSSARVIELTRSGGGRPPSFTGNGAEVADEVRKRMRSFYENKLVPAYLDPTGQELLDEGRRNYQRLGLANRMLVPWGTETVLLPWRGDRVLNTIAVALTSVGLSAAKDGVGLTISVDAPTVAATARELIELGQPDPVGLAEEVRIRVRDKYDEYLSDHLLSLAYASHALDITGAWEVFAALAAEPAEGADQVLDASLLDAVSVQPARLGQTPFAVVDIETTGFAPHNNDRIIEIAVVQADPDGVPTSSWTTLINPSQPPGPTHIHGIHDQDLTSAPTFGQVAEWVTHQLAGRIVVAHNAAFDLAFLNIEYERTDTEPPDWPTLDTLALAATLGNNADRTLHGCCTAAGIQLRNAHTAEGDAHATAQLLATYLHQARDANIPIDHLIDGDTVTPAPTLAPTSPRATRRTIHRPPTPETARLIGALSAVRAPNADLAINAFLAVVDEALLSADLNTDIETLLAEAARLGLSQDSARATALAHLHAVTAHLGGTVGAAATALAATLKF